MRFKTAHVNHNLEKDIIFVKIWEVAVSPSKLNLSLPTHYILNYNLKTEIATIMVVWTSSPNLLRLSGFYFNVTHWDIVETE